MRRLRQLLGIALLVCTGGVVPVAAHAAATSSDAELSGFTCQRAVDPAFRALSVSATMRPVTGTQGMRLQFVLEKSRFLHGHYRAVHGANLGNWIAPDNPTLGQHPGDVWKLTHSVGLLSAPAFYRLKVTFRWLGSGGKRLAQVVQQAGVCHQLELRPDLRVVSVSGQTLPKKPSDEAYVVKVVNHGLTGAGPFGVSLTTPDGSTTTRMVGWLGHHKSRFLRFVAPACTAPQTLTVVADPGSTVLDLDRTNNTLTVPCPAPATG